MEVTKILFIFSIFNGHRVWTMLRSCLRHVRNRIKKISSRHAMDAQGAIPSVFVSDKDTLGILPCLCFLFFKKDAALTLITDLASEMVVSYKRIACGKHHYDSCNF